MIPVQMDALTRTEDAYRAALAAMLEMDLDAIPAYEGMAADLQFDAWLASELNLSRFTLRQLVEPPRGFWLARVESPYPGYGVHTLVMQHSRVAHDPHPEPQPIDVPNAALQCELLLPLDPAQQSGRLALG